jgi:hypothetical protein
MLNIFEQPWLLFAVAFISLICLYISTLERKLYWLSLLILLSLAALNLLLEAKPFFLNPKTITILKILLPAGQLCLSIWLIISIVQLRDRSAYIWLLPIILSTAGFGLDLLVKTDMEKIKSAINAGQRAFQQEDIELLGSIISDKYQDSFHTNKQSLLQHFNSYFSEPLCDGISRTFMQTDKKNAEAVVTIAIFIAFNENSFVVRDYSVANAKVALKITLKKETDRQWRIYQTEIIEVNNQPFNWNAVSR